ncbi:MAG: glutamine--fructose-6-phosphate transaminase (isomerizing) [Rhodospirillales bacterium]
MCGIIGILGKTAAAPRLVEALRRLEYRGYDSAGIATLEGDGLACLRAPGKLGNLQALTDARPLAGVNGIGHTRWATHGAATEANAHPHCTPKVALVHNGIIENFAELKAQLAAEGQVFQSETDTEVVAWLVDRALAAGESPAEAVAAVLKRLEGAFSLVFLFQGEADLLIGARRGSPLAVGFGEGEAYLGSDALALAPFTNRIAYLEEDDWVVVTRAGARFFDASGAPVERAVQISQASALMADKANYRHFMAKEIHEQPQVIGRTLGHYVNFGSGEVAIEEIRDLDFAALDRLTVVACGTASLAGWVAKYWFERLARIGVDVDIASEFRYRNPPLSPDGLTLVISQSGETADTLAALRYCKAQGQRVAAIVNVPESTIAREADLVLPTLAGTEVGVASTKAFTCQLAVLLTLAIAAGRARGALDRETEARMVGELAELPRLAAETLRMEAAVEREAVLLSKVRHVLYLGRGLGMPLAMEGALKLKELSYIHAEGYAAGELKHGPIALIDETMPVIVLAPSDEIFDKTQSNIQEVAARHGRLLILTDAKGLEATAFPGARHLEVPWVPSYLVPLVYALPMQLLAYHTAVLMGTDVDQPRNLAKSVTVE